MPYDSTRPRHRAYPARRAPPPNCSMHRRSLGQGSALARSTPAPHRKNPTSYSAGPDSCEPEQIPRQAPRRAQSICAPRQASLVGQATPLGCNELRHSSAARLGPSRNSASLPPIAPTSGKSPRDCSKPRHWCHLLQLPALRGSRPVPTVVSGAATIQAGAAHRNFVRPCQVLAGTLARLPRCAQLGDARAPRVVAAPAETLLETAGLCRRGNV